MYIYIYTSFKLIIIIDSRDNEFAESYGIGSRCVNHGKSRKWHVNGRTVSDSGAGCYQVHWCYITFSHTWTVCFNSNDDIFLLLLMQYHCTKQGVVLSVLGVNFLCPCEGKEVRVSFLNVCSLYSVLSI